MKTNFYEVGKLPRFSESAVSSSWVAARGDLDKFVDSLKGSKYKLTAISTEKELIEVIDEIKVHKFKVLDLSSIAKEFDKCKTYMVFRDLEYMTGFDSNLMLRITPSTHSMKRLARQYGGS